MQVFTDNTYCSLCCTSKAFGFKVDLEIMLLFINL